MSYRVLVLPEARPDAAGAAAQDPRAGRGRRDRSSGRKPSQSPSLCRLARRRTARCARWPPSCGAISTASAARCARYGKGRVVWGLLARRDVGLAGHRQGLRASRGLDADLAWIHRRAGEADIYFVANLADRAQELAVRFRVAGRRGGDLATPTRARSSRRAHAVGEGRHRVPLELREREAVFVVFRRAGDGGRHARGRRRDAVDARDAGRAVGGSVPAEARRAGEAATRGARTWTANADAGVKYFSGTATYTRTVPCATSGSGRARGFCSTSARGRPRGGLAQRQAARHAVEAAVPGRRDRRAAPGENRLEIAVTNQWTNRLLGDRAAPAEKKVLGASGVDPGGIGAGPEARSRPTRGCSARSGCFRGSRVGAAATSTRLK